jgi:UPF0042 nucleotide-binding protein
MSDSNNLRVVILSGLSGAGKTVALRALEDIGYFCIDNLPVTLIEDLLSSLKNKEGIKNVAIVIDIREKGFFTNIYDILSTLKEKYKIEIFFLEAEGDVMIRRFKETRRPHPLMSLNKTGIEEAIEEERKLLFPIREAADKIVDTSNYTPHKLRHLVMSEFGLINKSNGLNISLISFGYKFGIPQNLDLLFDVRFLPNPYFVTELKDLKGIDKPVSSFVLNKDETRDFLIHMYNMIDFLIPQFINDGRSSLIIGIGCTGGKHRSPVIVQELSKHIYERHKIIPIIIHRDMD